VTLAADRARLLAATALLATAACWGSTFFLIHGLLSRVPVVDFLAVRFAIAAVVLLALAPGAVRKLGRGRFRSAVVLGVLYGSAQILQTAGLAHTAASVSGFITGMYVVCTPLFGALILRTRIVPMTWLAVGLATAGLGVLTLGGVSIGYGEALTLIAAMLYALHIVGLGAFEELVAHPATEGVPFVLETPGSRDAGDPQIALLQKLRER
jgi:drug/metabolite transporter (DMT)-like permease